MINKEEVEYVAKLAHIELTEEEKEKFAKELDSIIGFVQKLNELNTDKVMPTYHIVPLKNVMRKDIIGESLPGEKVLNIAPSRESGHYKVPKIIE